MPDVDIVIVSFNTREDLLACLASLDIDRPRRLHQITVVDNASTDGSVQAVRARFRDVRVIALDRNVGFGAANNVALRRPGAPLVLLLNSDTLVPAGAVDTLAGRLDAVGAVAAGPRLIDGRGRPEISFGPMLSPIGELRQKTWQWLAAADTDFARRAVASRLGRERTVDWVTGACLLLRRDAAEAAGFFDERYFMYEEDVDLCAALRARGGRILFTPRAEVVHRRGRSVARAGAPAASEYDRSHLAFYLKHQPRWAPWLRRWQRLRGRHPARQAPVR
jgi:GT2 family glycosyltransferase